MKNTPIPEVNPSPEPVTVLTSLPLEQGYDEFSPESLRVLNTLDMGGLVRQELVLLPVRKPKKDEWFRVHPDYQQQGGILELDTQKKMYWVSRGMQEQVGHDPCFNFRVCVLVVNRQGAPFIWPVKTNAEGCGTGQKHIQGPLEAMRLGKVRWIRMFWVHERSEYQIESSDLHDEPKFPEKPFPELLRLAFKDSVIDAADHPAILDLKGRVK